MVAEPADLINANISAARGNYGEAALDGAGALGPVASGVALGNRVRKILGKADDAADAVGAGKKGVTAEKAKNLAEADAKGIPRNQLGPSGKPKVAVVKRPTEKRARDTAQARSKGPLIKDKNPSKGRDHYHTTNQRGEKRRGKQNLHIEFPKRRGKNS